MENIRNFTIIAHVNHGKSTLADRLLELTKTISQKEMRPQYLDMMELERGKGITIKMHPVRMTYTLNTIPYTLNLIDTPGHIDFSYEVSRSLAAVEGAILLVDATKGIQAQTLANLELAKKPSTRAGLGAGLVPHRNEVSGAGQNLVIIPVVNKIDLPEARIEETAKELANLLKVPEKEVIQISAKYGTNVEQLLEVIIKKIPCPVGSQKLSFGAPPKLETSQIFKALIFDSKYDPFKGIIVFVRVFSGQIKEGEKIYLLHSKVEGQVKEVGFFKPKLISSSELKVGEIGYIATGIKEPGKVRVGDTIIKLKIKNEKLKISDTEPLPGYQEPKPVVFASLYPQNPENFDLLKEAILKLKLNDPSFTFEPETREALGRGFRCGFLGNLHVEILTERLRQEFSLNLIISTPSVIYKIINQKEKEILIYNPADWPTSQQIKEIEEPWVKLEVLTPNNFLGQVLEILEKLEGKYLETKYFGLDRVLLIYEVPLRKIITGFFDKLKSQTQGYASMNYQILGYKKGDLVKLEILIAGKKEEAFSKIVQKSRAFEEGKKIIKKLKEILPPQLFSVAIQAAISGKIIARETIRARGKDVIAPLYGGDYTRKRKLLEKQKKGKKRLKEIGKIRIPQNVFLEIFKTP